MKHSELVWKEKEYVIPTEIRAKFFSKLQMGIWNSTTEIHSPIFADP